LAYYNPWNSVDSLISLTDTLVLKLKIEEEVVSSVSMKIAAAPFSVVGAIAVNKELETGVNEEASVLPKRILLTFIKLLPFIVTVAPGKITLGVKSVIAGLK
jgi:hypothetical protein